MASAPLGTSTALAATAIATLPMTAQPQPPTIQQALALWTDVTNLITQRERLLASVADFERDASAPARLFLAGASDLRREEQKRRTQAKRMTEIDAQLLPLLASIQNTFGDVVCFHGRPYV
jgi:hypothetical protein